MNKPIILIGGTAGTGKTTLARDLCNLLCIDHRLGTGFIREVIKAETSEKKEPYLFRFTFEGNDPIHNIREQAIRMYSAIKLCIERAKNEGTSLIIEGNHLLPELYQHIQANDLYILKSFANYKETISNSTHTKRILSQKDIEGILKIDEYLKNETKKLSLPYITSEECKKILISKYGNRNEN